VCGTKRGQRWIGYKVHLTETCEADQPHLIIDVHTTCAAVSGAAMTGPIHHTLAARGLLPSRHGGQRLHRRQPAGDEPERAWDRADGPPDTSWLQHAGAGFDIGAFTIDWESRTARCPQGQTSTSWTAFRTPQAGVAVRVGFDPATCRACPCRASCTRSKTAPRTLALLAQAQHEAVQARRQEQQTKAWRQAYAQRAGVEGLLSQGVRAFGLRRSRYLGQAKLHLQHVLTALAINLVRLDAWLQGIAPAATRQSRFAALMATS
jgi:transposase